MENDMKKQLHSLIFSCQWYTTLVCLARSKKKIVSMRCHILSFTCLNLTIAIFFMIPLAIIRFLHNDYKVAILLLHFLIL